MRKACPHFRFWRMEFASLRSKQGGYSGKVVENDGRGCFEGRRRKNHPSPLFEGELFRRVFEGERRQSEVVSISCSTLSRRSLSPTSAGESYLEHTPDPLCASTNQFCNEGSLRHSRKAGALFAFRNSLWRHVSAPC